VALAFANDFFRRRSAVSNLHAAIASFGIRTIFKNWLACAALAQYHQGFIDRYAGQPCRKTRVFAEPLQIQERALKRSLHGVFRILLISKYAESRAVSCELVTLI